MILCRRALLASVPAICLPQWLAAAASPHRFDITRYGARGDGRFLNTVAIQRAIDACAAEGGGTVVVPAGAFVSGSIVLKPGVSLELRANAVLKGSTNLADYPVVMRRFVEAHLEPLRMALINARGNHGLRISGPGMLDGSGDPFWRIAFNTPKESLQDVPVQYHFPQLCFIQDCDDVMITGVTFRDPAFWNLHLYRCRRAIVEDCRFIVPHKIRAPCSDGTDVDSCQDVVIRRCHYSVDDDCIALKGTQGSGAAAYAEAPPVERITIQDCVFEKGLGAVTYGSNATIVSDVRVENCISHADMPFIRFKIRPDTPGQVYEKLHVRGVRFTPAAEKRWHGDEVFYGARASYKVPADDPEVGLIVNARLTHGTKVPAQQPGAIIRKVLIEDVTGTTKGFGSISGNATTVVEDFTLRNIDVRLLDPDRTSLIARGARSLVLENVRVNGTPARVVS